MPKSISIMRRSGPSTCYVFHIPMHDISECNQSTDTSQEMVWISLRVREGSISAVLRQDLSSTCHHM